MFELFITDLDGTLLDDDKKISDKNYQAIEMLREKQIAFSVFTGRNFYSAYDYLKVLNVEGLVALQNGALIIEMPSRKVINEIYLNASVAWNIYQLAKDRNFTIIAYTGYHETETSQSKDMMVEKNSIDCPSFDHYFQHNHERITFVDSLDAYFDKRKEIGQLAIIGNEMDLCDLLEQVSFQYSNEISHVLSPIGDDCSFLEFFGPKVSKGDALTHLLERYHTTAQKTVFIGDNFNDLPLLKKVGLSIAPENASKEIKEHCKMIVASNNHHAVGEAIQRIFF
ncbi:MAG TPA: Cof-type HAD-IIB family hydrolase [Thermotogota bacterium]|nr:Cof-type HAD-IIB family hydrolase [Thermotogota bacterium]